MDKQKFLGRQRQRRRYRVRKRIHGTADRPRLTVARSNQNIACQLVDDLTHRTLISVSTLDPQLRETVRYGGNKTAAQAVGQAIAQRALAAGIQAVRLDRGSSKYHGRIAALADAAREAGLKL